MSKIKSVSTFSKTLATGLKQLRNGKQNVWECAKFAISHYDAHGDHGCLNKVLDGLRAEGVGASAYAKWVEKYTDQVWSPTEKKLVKDENTSRETIADVVEAYKENFWGMVKMDQDAEMFGVEDFFKAMLKVVKQYENTERKVTDDPNAKAEVSKMKSLILSKQPQLSQ